MSLAAFLTDHQQLSRRYFMQGLGTLGAATLASWPLLAQADPAAPELAEVIAKLEPFFTPTDDFRDVSRGKPLPHSLPDEKKREVGLTRETWQLEVISDKVMISLNFCCG